TLTLTIIDNQFMVEAKTNIAIKASTYSSIDNLLNSRAIFDVDKDINITPCYLNRTGVSPKKAGVNK
ncbi:17494_t:CDS:2, partial [Racocetra persica]